MSREEILKRRARFVSAALILATGCTREADGNKASPLPTTEAKPSVAKPPAPPTPPPVKPPANRPPLTAKVTVTGEAKRAEAAARIEKLYEAIEQTANAIPIGCDVAEPACKTRFKLFYDKVADLRDQTYALGPPRCPPKLADDIAVQDMVMAHRAWLFTWLDAIEKAGRESALAQSGDAGTTLDDLHHEAAMAHPHPCLKFACP